MKKIQIYCITKIINYMSKYGHKFLNTLGNTSRALSLVQGVYYLVNVYRFARSAHHCNNLVEDHYRNLPVTFLPSLLCLSSLQRFMSYSGWENGLEHALAGGTLLCAHKGPCSMTLF